MDLFKNQSNLENTLDVVQSLLSLERREIGVITAAKGLVYGPVMIELSADGEIIDCSQLGVG